MNGIHDMGGMHGFGPVVREENEPVFHAPWEGRLFGIRGQAGRYGGNIDLRRFLIEQIPPTRYLQASYYERWLDSTLRYCEMLGLIDAKDRAAIDAGLAPEATRHARVEPATLRTSKGYKRAIDTPPLFRVGDAVRARNLQPAGHTRLPRYARGRSGILIADHGGFVFPDSNARLQGEQPKRLYTVRFTARELWGLEAHPKDTVSLDLWEPYLEPA